MTKFRASYSPNFRDKELVEEIIHEWNSGAQKFKLKTSGSTGPPKEILLNRELLIWSSTSTKNALKLTNERTLCCLPVIKTGGFMQLVRAMLFGWEIYFDEPSSRPLEKLKDFDFTLTSLTPQQIKNSLEQDVHKLTQINKILIGGAPLDQTTILQLDRLNNSYWETYGMTETASHVALKQVGVSNRFTPQKGVEISEKDNILIVKIPSLNLVVKTNDVVSISSDYSFVILGRQDNVINSGGVKIHPTIIEDHIGKILKERNIENDFYVTRKKDSILGEIAVLIVQGDTIPKDLQILSVLKSKLPKYTAPKEIVYVTHISFSDTGKKIRSTFEQLTSVKRITQPAKKS